MNELVYLRLIRVIRLDPTAPVFLPPDDQQSGGTRTVNSGAPPENSHHHPSVESPMETGATRRGHRVPMGKGLVAALPREGRRHLPIRAQRRTGAGMAATRTSLGGWG